MFVRLKSVKISVVNGYRLKMLEFSATSLPDYTDYLTHSQICDCKIETADHERTYHAHRAVLANASDFFLNVFTSGMQEDTERTVVLNEKYSPLFDSVFNFLYSGRIEVSPDELVSLLDYAHYFGIRSLTSTVLKVVEENLSKEWLLKFIDDCWIVESQAALDEFIPFIQQIFDEFEISELSSVLDVTTFCRVLSGISFESKEALTSCIEEFLGDWETTENEQEVIEELISQYN